MAAAHEQTALQTGAFLSDAVVEWFQSLPYWYEDERAIYVHAGLPRTAVASCTRARWTPR